MRNSQISGFSNEYFPQDYHRDDATQKGSATVQKNSATDFHIRRVIYIDVREKFSSHMFFSPHLPLSYKHTHTYTHKNTNATVFDILHDMNYTVDVFLSKKSAWLH